ncbi:MAG: hypothetical protein AB7L65_08620 [Hyphomonadaceae bacterium]
MKSMIAPALVAAAALAALSLGAVALAEPDIAAAQAGLETPDARSVASDDEVRVARRAYRAACERVENQGFCECVTAGVAQALSPADVRIAAQTLPERLAAEGDSAARAGTDTAVSADAMTRIETAESHYADACAQFR